MLNIHIANTTLAGPPTKGMAPHFLQNSRVFSKSFVMGVKFSLALPPTFHPVTYFFQEQIQSSLLSSWKKCWSSQNGVGDRISFYLHDIFLNMGVNIVMGVNFDLDPPNFPKCIRAHANIQYCPGGS